MKCRLQAGKGTARLAPWAAGERRPRQTQQLSPSAVGWAMGVASPALGAWDEAELTERGDLGACTARSGKAEREARDMARSGVGRMGKGRLKVREQRQHVFCALCLREEAKKADWRSTKP